jgi:urease accessory protein UreF
VLDQGFAVMVKNSQIALNDATEWLGDWHPLAEQLGSADGLLTLSTATAILRVRPVTDVLTLRSFLNSYKRDILLAFELPAIFYARGHADLNELRELVQLDCNLGSEPVLQEFADSSRRVGQGQLQKLRPLRDQRIVQRYLQAVETGRASGWHTLVYGLTLSVYSLPLRQGLLGYAHQTSRGLIYAAAQPLRLSERVCRLLFDQQVADLPASIERLLQERAAA